MAVCSWCRGEMATADSCSISAFHRGGRTYRHIPYGDETGPYPFRRLRCGDCGVERGGFHHPGCDVQQCPICRRQLLSCGCLFDEDVDEILDDLLDELDDERFDSGDDALDGDRRSGACDCAFCRVRAMAPGKREAALRDLLVRLTFTGLMSELAGADGTEVGGLVADAVHRAEPLGVDAGGNVTLTARLGGAEMLLRHGDYPECDVIDLDGFAMTTPLRSLIDRATEISELETSQNLARFMALGFVNPADAWRRLAEPDMAANPGAAVLRRLLPPTPRNL